MAKHKKKITRSDGKTQAYWVGSDAAVPTPAPRHRRDLRTDSHTPSSTLTLEEKVDAQYEKFRGFGVEMDISISKRQDTDMENAIKALQDNAYTPRHRAEIDTEKILRVYREQVARDDDIHRKAYTPNPKTQELLDQMAKRTGLATSAPTGWRLA